MQVELDQALLTAQAREDLTLLALCAFGLSGRHRIVVDDRAAWETWAETLPVDLCEEVLLVWDEGMQRKAIGSPSERVTVAPVPSSQFDATPLVVNPTEALVLLGRPLRVFLENNRNDGAFVLAFADAATRKAIEDAEREGWIVFEMGGGITELVERISQASGRKPREVFRTMYLCDSDAREPGKPSEKAATIHGKLGALSRGYKRPADHFGTVLTRRAAENYAPPGDVLAWACEAFGNDARKLIQEATTQAGRTKLALGAGNPGSTRRRLLAAIALKELGPEVRALIDMKEGREHHNPPPKPPTKRTEDSVWNVLDAFQKAALLDGFGARFSADFYTGRPGLKDETGEIPKLLATILQRL